MGSLTNSRNDDLIMLSITSVKELVAWRGTSVTTTSNEKSKVNLGG